MDGPDSSWNAEQDADDGEDLLFLVHQVHILKLHTYAHACPSPAWASKQRQ
jgi:hypothetical protein